MISLETAKKLKDAGLEWEPQVGDFYYNSHGYVIDTTLDLLNEVTVLINSFVRSYANRTVVFAPRLDQLLAEIEKRMYEYELTSYSAGYFTDLEDSFPKTYKLKLFDEEGIVKEFGDASNIFSCEESAAQALLWILEQEANA